MHTAERAGSAIKKSGLAALGTGFILSAVLALLFQIGISVAYKYFPGSIVLLTGLTIFCFLIFWMNIKYDQYLDVNDVFLKTISFSDFNMSNYKFSVLFARFIRPVNPYIGALGTISGLLLVLCAVPALIIHWTVKPDNTGIWLGITVYIMSAGLSLLYSLSNKDRFPSAVDKVLFFSGILIAPAGVIKLIS